MATVYDVEPNILIEETAKELSKLIKAPDWAGYVKTGMAKDRPPQRDDWWQVRAAAVLRTIYRAEGPIGVQKLRVKYGSKKNRGHKPEVFYKASGKIIRLIIQQLEKEGLVKQFEIDVHKGRVITPKGKSMLDKIASRIVGAKPAPVKEEKKATEEPVEETPKAEPKKKAPKKAPKNG